MCPQGSPQTECAANLDPEATGSNPVPPPLTCPGKPSNMGDGAGYIQSDELAVFWTRGAELTARMGLLMHQLQRERGLMTLHVADASWGAQCAQRQDHTRYDDCAN